MKITTIVSILVMTTLLAAQEKGAKAHLEELGAKLKVAVQNGEMTSEEAMAKYRAAAAKMKGGTGKAKAKAEKGGTESLLQRAARLQAMVKAGTLTQEQANAKFRALSEARAKGKVSGSKVSGSKVSGSRVSGSRVDLERLGKRLKAAVQAGKLTEKEAMAKYQAAARAQGGGKKRMSGKGKGKGAMRGTFYAIFIGRLKSKDVELGEFELDVDHITSIYGDRSRKAPLIGKTVQVTGVSGPWLDKLLLMKKGETLKLRSMTLVGNKVSLSSKATVLEKTAPFSKDSYPIPPESFRGFRGTVTGKIESLSAQGYELILRVKEVNETSEASEAKDPKSIVGRLMEVRGFYDQKFRSGFEDLKIGDTIRFGAVHGDRTMDSLQVRGKLENVGTK